MLPDDTAHDCPMDRLTEEQLKLLYALVETVASMLPVSPQTMCLIAHNFFHIYEAVQADPEAVETLKEAIAEEGIHGAVWEMAEVYGRDVRKIMDERVKDLTKRAGEKPGTEVARKEYRH